MSKIGEKIRNSRMEKGYSLKEFSKRVNIAQSTISQYETGTQSPTINKLNVIAEALGICFYVKFGKENKKRENNVGE